MKILVTGATGFVGRNLCRELISRGHQIVVLSRDAASAQKSLGLKGDYFSFGTKYEVPSEALKDVDAIVHLAGEPVADGRWTEEKKKRIFESRIVSTGALVAAVQAMPADSRPKVFVCTSAIGIYGDQGDKELTESSGGGEGFLANVCKHWEHDARLAQPFFERTAIIRVGIVLGREGGALAKMLPVFRSGLAGTLGAGRQWMSWIHIDDLVNLYIEALTNKKYTGVINGVAPEPVRNKDFTKTMGKIVHKPTMLAVPEFALKLALGEAAQVVVSSQKVVPAAAKNFGFQFKYPNLNDALKNLL